jgi:hypothetical protein
MRKVIDPQLQFGEADIAAIHLDPKSRDDIPQILRGLQYIYTTPELREAVFAILQEVIPQGMEGKANPDTGRPGMEQWKILVLGVLRQGLNADYDRLHELSNQHSTLRQMLARDKVSGLTMHTHIREIRCQVSQCTYTNTRSSKQSAGSGKQKLCSDPDFDLDFHRYIFFAALIAD